MQINIKKMSPKQLNPEEQLVKDRLEPDCDVIRLAPSCWNINTYTSAGM
jgi:hypothetical protein